MSTLRKKSGERGDTGAPAALAASAAARTVDADWVARRLLLFLFVCGLLYAVWTASIGWGNTLNDRHSFRQSQTAMTARYLVGQPFKLAYETPALGKPWAIPLEFPLYQWIVARLVGVFGTPLDQTGRFVSLVFFLLATIPIHRLVRASGVAPGPAWVPVTLFVISPFYIFWGRTFMIETAAMCLGMWYLCAAVETRRSPGWGWWAAAIVCGSLAALVKITTFGVFLAPCTAVACIEAWRAWRSPAAPAKRIPSATWWLAVSAVPVAMGVIWARFATAVRADNPFAGTYLTGKEASDWVYGTLQQKLSLQVWTTITDRFVELIGYPPLAWLLLGATLAITLVAPRRWRETTACFGCYLLGPAAFTNVHFVHDYYMNANGVFLILAVGFAIVALLEDVRTRKAGWCFLTIAVFTAVTGHRVMHLPRQTLDNSEILQAAEYIRSATPDDSVIVCVGQDWSPLVPYYADRRAVMIPMDPRVSEELVDRALANLRGEKVSALVAIEPIVYPLERAKRQMTRAGFDVPTLSVKGLPFR